MAASEAPAQKAGAASVRLTDRNLGVRKAEPSRKETAIRHVIRHLSNALPRLALWTAFGAMLAAPQSAPLGADTLELDDLDLSGPPPDYESFMNGVAFFAANDISNREPIILDTETGYTKAKSHPTYLPTGPWLIRGSYLKPKTVNEGRRSLAIELRETAQVVLLDVQKIEGVVHDPPMLARLQTNVEEFARGAPGFVQHDQKSVEHGVLRADPPQVGLDRE